MDGNRTALRLFEINLRSLFERLIWPGRRLNQAEPLKQNKSLLIQRDNYSGMTFNDFAQCRPTHGWAKI